VTRPFLADRPTATEVVSDAGSVVVPDYGAGMTADPVVQDRQAECAVAVLREPVLAADPELSRP
jgi:hypothetical protein